MCSQWVLGSIQLTAKPPLHISVCVARNTLNPTYRVATIQNTDNIPTNWRWSNDMIFASWHEWLTRYMYKTMLSRWARRVRSLLLYLFCQLADGSNLHNVGLRSYARLTDITRTRSHSWHCCDSIERLMLLKFWTITKTRAAYTIAIWARAQVNWTHEGSACSKWDANVCRQKLALLKNAMPTSATNTLRVPHSSSISALRYQQLRTV